MSIIHVRHEKRSNKQFKLGCSFFIGQSLEIISEFRCFEIRSKTDESRQDGSIQSCLKRLTMITQLKCNQSRGRLPTDHRYKLASDFRVKRAADCKEHATCRIASSLLEFWIPARICGTRWRRRWRIRRPWNCTGTAASVRRLFDGIECPVQSGSFLNSSRPNNVGFAQLVESRIDILWCKPANEIVIM